MGKILKNKTEEFICLMAKLDLLSFFGLLKIMGIEMKHGDGELKEFDLLWDDAVTVFESKDRSNKRKLISFLKEVV